MGPVRHLLYLDSDVRVWALVTDDFAVEVSIDFGA